MLQDWNSLSVNRTWRDTFQIIRKEKRDSIQTLQTTSHCLQHATRLELTSCQSYMERRIQIIWKEKRDTIQTLQTTSHCLQHATRLELTLCESHMERHIQIIRKEKRLNTDTANNITLSSTCYKIGTHSL